MIIKPNNRRLAIVSHFDIDSIIDEYVTAYLFELRKVADTIVMISTSALDETEIKKAERLCDKIICRDNIGYDFLSYKVGLYDSGIGIHDYDEIILCNDSVYGPFNNLENMFLLMESKKCDFWGITSRQTPQYHIQSYFLVFRRKIIISEPFQEFFRNIHAINSKKEIIQKYEIGLTVFFKNKGFVPLSFYNDSLLDKFLIISQIINGKKTLLNKAKLCFKYFTRLFFTGNYNPSLVSWKRLLANNGPFIKIELLRINAGGIYEAEEIINFLERSKFETRLIKSHIERTKKSYTKETKDNQRASDGPLCTVMIPTYNQAEYLRRTIDSALAQDYPNLEIIVADDHSSDGTVAILESYRDTRLSWHTNSPNLGRVANYHDLLYSHAKGKWVINLDGDDFFVDTTFISSAMRVAEADPEAMIVFGDRIEADNPGPEIEVSKNAAESKAERFDGMEYLLSWPRKNNRIHHLTSLYRREKATSIGFYLENIISSDYESLFRLMAHGAVWHIPAKVALWRHHAGNASVNKSEADKLADLALFDSVARHASKMHPSSSEKISRWHDKNIARKYYTFLLDAFKETDLSGLRPFNGLFDKKYPGVRFRVYVAPATWIKIFLHVIKK